MPSAAIAARHDISERRADNVRNLLASQVLRAAVARVLGHRRPDCPRRTESCSLCGKRGHLSQMCRSSVGNASARAVEAEPAEPEGERNSTRVGTVKLRHLWNPVGRFVCLRQLRSPV